MPRSSSSHGPGLFNVQSRSSWPPGPLAAASIHERSAAPGRISTTPPRRRTRLESPWMPGDGSARRKGKCDVADETHGDPGGVSQDAGSEHPRPDAGASSSAPGCPEVYPELFTPRAEDTASQPGGDGCGLGLLTPDHRPYRAGAVRGEIVLPEDVLDRVELLPRPKNELGAGGGHGPPAGWRPCL